MAELVGKVAVGDISGAERGTAAQLGDAAVPSPSLREQRSLALRARVTPPRVRGSDRGDKELMR